MTASFVIVTDPDTLRQIVAEELSRLTPAQAEADEVLNTKGAARLLGVDEQTVRTEAEAGRLPGLLIGRGWKFSSRALMQALHDTRATDITSSA